MNRSGYVLFWYFRNELKVPEGWLLNTVYRRKLIFFGHIKRHDSLEKAELEGRVPGKRSLASQAENEMERLHHREAWIRHE